MFLAVAVVVGRGGSPEKLLEFDIAGALATDDEAGSHLIIEELHVTRRVIAGNVDVVVISGVVHNTGDEAHKAVRVNVHFGAAADGPPEASGYAWSDVNALKLATLPADDISALAEARPKSPAVSPGDRAPFIIIARAPADGAPVVVAAVKEN